MQLMDAFAHRVGRRTPLHLPLFSKLFAKAIIREEHMQQVELPMPHGAPIPRVPSFPTTGKVSIRLSKPGAPEPAHSVYR
jgi:hypothetical protein